MCNNIILTTQYNTIWWYGNDQNMQNFCNFIITFYMFHHRSMITDIKGTYPISPFFYPNGISPEYQFEAPSCSYMVFILLMMFHGGIYVTISLISTFSITTIIGTVWRSWLIFVIYWENSKNKYVSSKESHEFTQKFLWEHRNVFWWHALSLSYFILFWY